MLVNLKNMCFGSVDDVVLKKSEREFVHIAFQMEELTLFQSDIANFPAYIVAIPSNMGPSPKIHFFDKDKAQALYDLLVHSLVNKVEYLEIDVIEHGAL